MIPPDKRIQFSHSLAGKAKAIFRMVDRMGLEGMVSKRCGSVYRSGPSTAWLKTKTFIEGDFDLLGVERERGKPAFALMAEPGTGRYVGSAFVSVNREMRERLWKRVQEHAGPAPKDMKKRPATQWVKPGIKARVKHLRGEEDLRHASLQDFWDCRHRKIYLSLFLSGEQECRVVPDTKQISQYDIARIERQAWLLKVELQDAQLSLKCSVRLKIPSPSTLQFPR
ncbi:hypothetical protein [Mesorhizobium sp.]|uniref:hypothetical protein n=1 Tax=Mesorhizobium sp. TaxID=1871066 RepID=UPI0025E1427E|nr:hypothetical protein [Mesorhizobium sp.]